MQFVGLVLFLALFAAYAGAIALADERWGGRGALVVLGIAVVTNVAWGTLTWWPPHPEVSAIGSRSQDWFCHAVNVLPAAVVIGLAALAGARWPYAPGRGPRIASAVLFAVPAALMATWLMIWWVIAVLGCDTL